MRILVTGAGGFVGSYLARALSEEHEVVGNYRTATDAVMSLRDERLSLIQCEVHHTSALEGPYEAIVHCAAAAGPWCDVDHIVNDNIMAMQSLVRDAVKWETKTFIFLSSISTYGQINVPMVDENTPRTNPEPYGMSKTYGEELLKTYRIPSLSLRLPGILGPGANLRNWLPGVARKMKAGEAITAYNLDAPYNNAVHVADLAEFIGKVLDGPMDRADVAVLGAGSQISVREALERLSAELGVPLRLEERAAPHRSFFLSSAWARHVWGYTPMHIAEMIGRYASEIA